MLYTVTISLLIEKLETTKLFISNSVRVYRYICEIFWLYVPMVGLFTPCFVPRGGFLYTMIVPVRVFAPFRSSPGGMLLDEIDTFITRLS